MSNKYKVYPRSKVEKLVIEFIEEHKIYAQYGKDSEGLFTKMAAWNHPDDSIYGITARS